MTYLVTKHAPRSPYTKEVVFFSPVIKIVSRRSLTQPCSFCNTTRCGGSVCVEASTHQTATRKRRGEGTASGTFIIWFVLLSHEGGNRNNAFFLNTHCGSGGPRCRDHDLNKKTGRGVVRFATFLFYFFIPAPLYFQPLSLSSPHLQLQKKK